MPLDRQAAFSASPYEARIGFARAVRAGQLIFVSGCGPVAPDGGLAGGNDPAAQARRCVQIIAEALAKLDADLYHVVRTRMYLTRIADWPAVSAVHAEVFGAIRPAATLVAVQALANSDWLVEIEADAVVP